MSVLEITNTNGKVWMNSDTPHISSTFQTVPRDMKLGNDFAFDVFRRNKVTLLAVSYSTFADPAIDTFLAATDIQDIHKIIIRPILNPLKWLLWSKLIAPRSDSFAIFGDVPGAVDVFGMENKYAGYVFVVDSDGKIRWKAAGPATPAELLDLNATINKLKT